MMDLDHLLHAAAQRVTRRINAGTERAHAALKAEAEHKRRSAGQRHRQLCERVARVYAETSVMLKLIDGRYGRD
jgi:phage protein D